MPLYPDLDWLNRSNAETLDHIERQGRSSPGLVPFIGAGLSTAFGLKDWKNLLLHAAPPRVAPLVRKQLDKWDYEGAAETLLKELTPDGFQNMVAASAHDSHLRSVDFTVGTVSLLPLLATGPVVTTNFDRVLERAFQANGVPFESVIYGPRPDLIVDALHGNRRVLVKLHGDWQDRVGRTFAKSDYDTNYGKAQPKKKRELLESAETLLFLGRSLLFIGASLAQDRTVELLERLHRMYAGIRHFAIMSVPARELAFKEKEAQLRALGVLPLWYRTSPDEGHALQVERLLRIVVERISARPVETPASKAELPELKVAALAPLQQPARHKLGGHFERIVRLIEDGRLTFFLGSAIHAPTRLLAGEFYDEMARIFECEALNQERFAVAQYIADRYGRQSLYSEIRKLFARTSLVSRETHELFAAWRQFRTPSGTPVPFPMIVTTNYDYLLERRLDQADLPYHLLSYQTDGPSRGLFYHRDSDDSLRIIERPQNIQTLSPGFIIVKLNGGFDRQSRIPESYATTRTDYWELAARIPEVLPAIVRKILSTSPLLMLGSGLLAADIESVIRFSHRNHPGSRSWAVVQKADAHEYWRQCGVEILNQPVSDYVRELHARLAMVQPATPVKVRARGRARKSSGIGARKPKRGQKTARAAAKK